MKRAYKMSDYKMSEEKEEKSLDIGNQNFTRNKNSTDNVQSMADILTLDNHKTSHSANQTSTDDYF